MEKDQDYAWIIVGAGVILMLVGPATYTTSGLLFEDVNIGSFYHMWILNTMYNVFMLSGMFAGPLSTVFTQRKIALISCLIAAVGFLMAALTLKHSVWLFVAFTGFVGVGLGLAVHVTFLLVMSKFEKHQGLATGVLQMSAGIGYFVAPFLYNILVTPQDRFHIKALVTALAFLGAILYISPETWHHVHVKTECRKSKSNSCSVEIGASSSRICGPEVVPLMELRNSEPMDIYGKSRKRSQYLLAVSASILPNIPEESEGPSAAPTGTCTPVSHTSMNNLSSQKSFTESKGPELSEINVLECLNSEYENQSKLEKRGSTVSFDDVPDIISEGSDHEQVTNNNEVEVLKHTVERLNSEMYSDTADALRSRRNSRRLRSVSTPARDEVACMHRLVTSLKTIDLKYFKNIKFVTLAVGCALAVLSYPTVPLVLYAYINSIKPSDSYNGEAETALLIIFSVDVVSRLLISYASDLPWLNKRAVFFLCSLCGSILVAGMGFLKDSTLIYIFCVCYGISQGALIALESLMLADVFGMACFSTTYGLYHFIKVTINILVTVIIRSPTAAYTYAIHSITPDSNEKYRVHNETYVISDPLDLFSEGKNHTSDENSTPFITLFLILSIPGMLSAMISTGWNVWVRLRQNSIYNPSFNNSTNSKVSSPNSPERQNVSSIEV